MNKSDDARNRRTRPRNPDKVASLYELKNFYKLLITELDECNRQRRAIDEVAKDRRLETNDQRKTIKKQSKEIVGLTQASIAAGQAKKGVVWSGAAATAVSILYRIWQSATGYPGGRQWVDVWEMPEVVAFMTGVVGMVFAWAYKILHPERKN